MGIKGNGEKDCLFREKDLNLTFVMLRILMPAVSPRGSRSK